MAEKVSPNNAGPVAEVTRTDGTTHSPLTIDQFWDENKLIPPWIDQYLPQNRMWKDAIFLAYNCFFSVVIVVILSMILLLPDKFVFSPGILLITWDSYLLAKLNTRMARAQGKFLRAKLNARPLSERVRDGVHASKNG
ncbi:hypothetical protein FJ420_11620 [Mesorhizobium sp. B3-1-3]|uniref:hypothetical protein n=1 Tax=unclassified Mesorhizobium TaxID=325217 RepID=UPI001125C836|nr:MULTISPECIES: hypothetical protein [unclassified Mesorhizobium]TPI65525.1 hypothetical protein FJ424_16060 [Mesorhizobium sp. B3-1-8]TPI72720.1 hypothetical protein FJ420_11620 [Mesorhizobium sp. B3-1-3]